MFKSIVSVIKGTACKFGPFITSHKRILQLLDNVVIGGSVVQLYRGKNRSGRSLSCVATEANETGFLLELPMLDNYEFIHSLKEVTCTFGIADEFAGLKFYRFTSNVKKVLLRGMGGRCIRLEIPNRLLMDKSSSFFSIDPPKHLIREIQVRPETGATTPYAYLGKPIFGNNGCGKSVRITELSAGAIGMEVDGLHLMQTSLPAKPGGRWLLKLSLKEPDNNTTWDCWILGMVRYVQTFAKGKGYRVDLLFEHIAPTPGGHNKFVWKAVDTSAGIPEIENWIFKRQVDQVSKYATEDFMVV